MTPVRVTTLLGLGLVLSIVTALCVGAVRYTPLELATEAVRGLGFSVSSSLDEAHTIILGEIRLPRVLLAALIGGALALTGVILQVVFQNPMADASLLGVGSGAALGAVIAVKLGWSFDVFLALPAAAFVGARATRMIVLYEGRIVDAGPPQRVMRGEALGRAFGVSTSEARSIDGLDVLSWRFERLPGN